MKYVNFDEYSKNKEDYEFEVEIPLKSELGLDRKSGKNGVIEPLLKRINIRVSDLEEYILKIGSKKENMSRSEFVRNLILLYAKDFVKIQVSEKYASELEKLKKLEEEKLKIEEEREEMQFLRGKDKQTANKLCYRRNKLKYQLENLNSDIKAIEDFLTRYEKCMK